MPFVRVKPLAKFIKMPDDLSFLDKYVKQVDVSDLLERMRGSTFKQESGGNYQVRRNQRTGAVGGFQVMPANIPNWTKTYVGRSYTPDEFERDPKAQEAVFSGEMGKYLRKARRIAPDDDTAIRMAAAAWYGGEGAMERYDDPKRFRPNEPSFREYTSSVLNKSRTNSPNLSFLDKYVDAKEPTFLDKYLPSQPNPTEAQNVYQSKPVPPQPLPAGINPAEIISQPVPEADETIALQMQAAGDPNVNTRSSVFFPPNDAERALKIANASDPKKWGLFPKNKGIDGYFLVDFGSAKKLKLRNAQDIQQFIDKNPKALSTLTGIVDTVDNTGGGQPVVTAQVGGKEAASAVVTDEEKAQHQADVYREQFPQAEIGLTTTDDITGQRVVQSQNLGYNSGYENSSMQPLRTAQREPERRILSELQSNENAAIPQRGANQNYTGTGIANQGSSQSGGLQGSRQIDSGALRHVPESELGNAPQGLHQSTRGDLDLPPVSSGRTSSIKNVGHPTSQVPNRGQAKVAGRTVGVGASAPALDKFTDKDFRAWAEYNNVAPTNENRKRFSAELQKSSDFGSSVEASVNPSDFKIDGEPVTAFSLGTTVKGGQLGAGQREPGKPTDDLNRVINSFAPTTAKDDRDAAIQALVAVGRNWDITEQEAAKYVDSLRSPLAVKGWQAGDEIQITYKDIAKIRGEGAVKTDIAIEQAQNRDTRPDLRLKKPSNLNEFDSEKALEQRIKQPGYSAQQIGSDAINELFTSPLTAAQKAGWAFGTWWHGDKLPEPSQESIEAEKDRLLKQYGSYAKAYDAEKYYQDMTWGETAVRMARQTAGSFAKNLISGTGKSIAFAGQLLEDVNPVNVLLPDEAKIGVRNAVNIADFLTRLMQTDSKTAWKETDWAKGDDISKQQIFRAMQEFDKAIGDDPVLKHRFLGALSDAGGSAAAFVALGALMPSMPARLLGKTRDFSLAVSGATQMAGAGYEEAKDARNGLTEAQAKAFGVIQGLLGTTEMVGAGAELAQLLKTPTLRRQFANALLEVGKTVKREAKQEFGQEVFQTTSGKAVMAYLKDTDPSTLTKLTNALNRLPKQIAETVSNEGLIAIITGGAMGGATAAATTASKIKSPTEPATSTEDVPEKPQTIDTKAERVDSVDTSEQVKEPDIFKDLGTNEKGEATYKGETLKDIEERRDFPNRLQNLEPVNLRNLAKSKGIEVATDAFEGLSEDKRREIAVSMYNDTFQPKGKDAAPEPQEKGFEVVEPERRKMFIDVDTENLMDMYHRLRSNYHVHPSESLDRRIETIGDELAYRANLPEGTMWGNRGDRDDRTDTPRETLTQPIAPAKPLPRGDAARELPQVETTGEVGNDARVVKSRPRLSQTERAKIVKGAAKRGLSEEQGNKIADAYVGTISLAKPAPQEPQAKPKTPPLQPAVSADQFQDYGEKIGGAKKDLARSLDAVTDEALLTQPLSKVFPRPNFAKLIADKSVSLDGAKILSFLYDNIPAKPRKSWKVKGWADNVNQAVAIYRDVLGPNPDAAQVFLNLARKSKITTLADQFDIYSAWLDATGFPDKSVSMQGYEIKLFRDGYGGNNTGQNEYLIVRNGLIKGRYESAQSAAKALLAKLQTPTQTVFNIYQDRTTKDYFIGKKGAGGIVRLITGLESAQAARTHLAENQTQLEQMWEALKFKKGVERRDTGDEVREAKDWRNGKDITSTEEFAKTFGFRGVEFGNWVKQGASKNERQQAINDSFDALMDLADLLNIDPRAISLNGELALALGARGSGDASAHYEPGKVVINLTKTRGKGSLGHEWWHALDNHFGKRRGEKGGFVTDFPRVRKIRDSGMFIDDPSLRVELLKGYENVVQAIKDSELPKRSRRMDATRSTPYWSTIVEMSARSFENYIITRLGEKGQRSDFLANFRDMADWGKAGFDADAFPYPTASEQDAINQSFDELFAAMEQVEQDGNVTLFHKLEVTNEMRDVAKRYTDDLFEVAKFSRHGAQISAVNLETYGVMRQLINTALGEDSDFGGTILEGEQIDKVRQALADVDTSTWPPRAKANLKKFASEFDKAAKHKKKPIVSFILIPDAITEEAVHGAFYQTVAENTIEKWQSPEFVKNVLASPLYKATTVEENYGKQTDAIKAHEFIAKLLGGKWTDLGIDPDAHKDEILETLRDWKDDYEKIHGKFDEAEFRNASEMAEYFFAAAEEGFANQSKGTDKQESRGDENTVKREPDRSSAGRAGVEPDTATDVSPKQGVSKIGKSIEAKAVEQGLTEGFPETAGYDKKHVRDQIDRINKLIAEDVGAVREMALGLTPIPPAISPVMLLRGMEEVAKTNKDAQLQYELANSPLVSETSYHAQEMRMMREREQDSATAMIQSLRRERASKMSKWLRGRTVEAAIKEEAEQMAATMKTHKRRAATRASWDSFIASIEC